MRHADWVRIRTRVGQLDRKTEFFVSAAWATVGIGVSVLLSLVSWLVTDAQLSSTDRPHFVWMFPALIAVLIASAVLSVAFFMMNSKLNAHAAVTVNQIVEDMDVVYEPVAEAVSAQSAIAKIPIAIDQAKLKQPVRDRRSASKDRYFEERSAVGRKIVDRVLADPTTQRRWEVARTVDNRALAIAPGETIEHADFGVGRVTAVTGVGEKRIAEVHFNGSGRKRLLIQIAPIRKIDA